MQRIRRCGGATLVVALVVMVLSAAVIAPAAGALSMKACQLIVAKDVQGVLGDGYTPQNMVENQIMSVCGYTKGKESVVSIGLQQSIYDSAQFLKMTQAGIKQQGVGVTPVGGLGEGAFYVLGPNPQENPGQFQLYFGKGNQYVIISVVTSGKPNIAAAQKLAKIAYSRLK